MGKRPLKPTLVCSLTVQQNKWFQCNHLPSSKRTWIAFLRCLKNALIIICKSHYNIVKKPYVDYGTSFTIFYIPQKHSVRLLSETGYGSSASSTTASWEKLEDAFGQSALKVHNLMVILHKVALSAPALNARQELSYCVIILPWSW